MVFATQASQTGALTVAVASKLVAFLRFGSGTPEAASAMPEVTARAVSPRSCSARSFRTVAPNTFTAVFELRQIVLGDSFPHYVHAGFWAGLRWRRHG